VGEQFGVDETHRLGSLGQVYDHEVGLSNNVGRIVEHFSAEPAGAVTSDERVVGHQIEAEGRRPLGHERADPTEPQNAKCLTVELDAVPTVAVPLTSFEVGASLRNVSRHRQQQRNRVLGCRNDV